MLMAKIIFFVSILSLTSCCLEILYPLHIEGTVTDKKTGTPVANVVVSVVDERHEINGDSVIIHTFREDSVPTDSSGYFEISCEFTQYENYLITRKQGYADSRTLVQGRGSTTVILNVESQ
jgi:hypothetical protein